MHILITNDDGYLSPGINAAPNLGDDLLYSGTVAAAMEGRYPGLPVIAVSPAGGPATHCHNAAVITRCVAERLQTDPPQDWTGGI